MRYPRHEGEANDEYILRLGQANVGTDDAIFLALERVKSDDIRQFEDFIVPQRIRTIRSKFPRLREETDHEYTLRLGRNDIYCDDAVLAAVGWPALHMVRFYQDHLEFQSMAVQHRIIILRNQYPRQGGEDNTIYIKRLGLAGLKFKDAVLLATGDVEPEKVRQWGTVFAEYFGN